MVSLTPFPITTLPAPYDIIWCRFPVHDDLGNPGPKPRPGLVRNVATTPGGYGEVQIIYGTTNLKMSQRPNDFFVTNAAEMNSCGLFRATRFDLDNVAWIPWANEWFECLPSYSSPIIGHLSDHAIKMLQILVGQRQARIESSNSE